MKMPSRFMPKYERASFTAKDIVFLSLFLGLVFLALAYTIWKLPLVLAFFVVLAMLGIYANWRENRRLKSLAAERPNEGICTFSRSFDRKRIDTWIIRAVYEELQFSLDYSKGTCPLTASDRFEEDLKIESEDLEDLVDIIAQRTGRSLENPENNPYYDKVSTVKDLVLFINYQPKLNS